MTRFPQTLNEDSSNFAIAVVKSSTIVGARLLVVSWIRDIRKKYTECIFTDIHKKDILKILEI